MARGDKPSHKEAEQQGHEDGPSSDAFTGAYNISPGGQEKARLCRSHLLKLNDDGTRRMFWDDLKALHIDGTELAAKDGAIDLRDLDGVANAITMEIVRQLEPVHGFNFGCVCRLGQGQHNGEDECGDACHANLRS